MQIVLLAMIAGVPLILMPGIFFHFNTTPKVALLLFAVPVLFVFCKQHVKNILALCFVKEGRIFFTLLGALWIACGLSVIASTNSELSIHGSLWRRSGWLTETALLILALFIAAWLSGEAHRLRLLIRTIAVTGSVAAIYGIFQYFGHDPFLSPGTYQAGEGIFRITRPPGTIGHADYFASWLLMIVFPIAALTVLEQNRLMRIASRIACATIAVAILFTGTRAAWLGLLVGLVSLLAMKSFRVARASWVAGAAVGVAIFAFTMSPAGARLRARIHWSRDDTTGGARALLWRDSMLMAAHKPWLGFGEETFTTQFPRFASVDLARAYPDFYQESPHNLFLDALDSEGFVGLSCLTGLIVLGLASGWRARRAGNPIAELTLAGFIGTLVCLQFTVLIAPTSLYFYLAIGMLVSLRAIPLPRTKRVAAGAGFSIAYWITAAASLLLPFFAVRLILADRGLANVQQRIDTGDAGGAALAYANARRWMPPGAGFDLPYSRAMAQLAQRSPLFAIRIKAWAEAKEAGVRATTTAEDRQNAWYSLATLYAAENNEAATESALRNAIACAPNWFKPHWMLANVLALTGRNREAMLEAAAAADRDAGRDPEVTATWKALSHSP